MPCPRTQLHFARPGIELVSFWLVARFPNHSAIWPPHLMYICPCSICLFLSLLMCYIIIFIVWNCSYTLYSNCGIFSEVFWQTQNTHNQKAITEIHILHTVKKSYIGSIPRSIPYGLVILTQTIPLCVCTAWLTFNTALSHEMLTPSAGQGENMQTRSTLVLLLLLIQQWLLWGWRSAWWASLDIAVEKLWLVRRAVKYLSLWNI